MSIAQRAFSACAALSLAASVAHANLVLSDFNGTGFSAVTAPTAETVGPTFDTLNKPNTQFAITAELNYDPNGINLTGLTGFNVTYTLAIGAGAATSSLGFFVRDLDGNQVQNFVTVNPSASFVTTFVPITTTGLDLTRTRYVRFSSSDPNFSSAQLTYQIDNITAVGATAPEPAAWILVAIPLAALAARRLKS